MIRVLMMASILSGCSSVREGDGMEKRLIWCVGACVSASSEKREYEHQIVVDPNDVQELKGD